MNEFVYRPAPLPSIGCLGLACLWIGLILGVSFLATPAKFLAQSLPLAVALDVGRHTFAVFNKVEWLLGVGLVAFAALAMARTRTLLICTVPAIAVLLETLWLLPLLDQRVSAIIAGQPPPASQMHSVYIALEILKVVTLAVIAIGFAKEVVAAGKK
jgi:hypothetical protein